MLGENDCLTLPRFGSQFDYRPIPAFLKKFRVPGNNLVSYLRLICISQPSRQTARRHPGMTIVVQEPFQTVIVKQLQVAYAFASYLGLVAGR